MIYCLAIMGGLGHHHLHPYIWQTVAFLGSLALPGMVFALLGGAWWEQGRRRGALEPD
ncbi:MAG: hypothetical protein WBG27_10550 [Candidatus Aquilonibacter sp.]